ncbi:MAG: FAD-linked oxidase, partial [Motilibacteraceae bacterium]
GVDRLLELAGPDADLSRLIVELRQLGGATTPPAPGPYALSCLDGEFVLFALGMAPVPALAEHGRAEAQRVVEAMRPWANERHYLNFAEDAVDAASGYDPASAQQLARLREQLDPTGVLQPNHPVRG